MMIFNRLFSIGFAVRTKEELLRQKNSAQMSSASSVISFPEPTESETPELLGLEERLQRRLPI